MKVEEMGWLDCIKELSKRGWRIIKVFEAAFPFVGVKIYITHQKFNFIEISGNDHLDAIRNALRKAVELDPDMEYCIR